MIDTVSHRRRIDRQVDAYVVAAVFDRCGSVAFGLGDGTVRLAGRAEAVLQSLEVSKGGILTLAGGPADQGFVCGTDCGQFALISGTGTIACIRQWPGKWVDRVAAFSERGAGLMACAVGRNVHVFTGDGSEIKTFSHGSTVSDIAFDPKGKRLAASHYNGASIWYIASKTDNPRIMEWKGSHTAIAFHPGGDAVVTAMQENALHGWRFSDGQNMAMNGYPAKTESLAFTRGGKWLASSGADAIVLWPFFSGGPMGKAPLEIGGGGNVLCTRVACQVGQDMCAAGFADGSVIVADVASRQHKMVSPAMGDPVTALAWSVDGRSLAFGTEGGSAVVIDFSA